MQMGEECVMRKKEMKTHNKREKEERKQER